MKPTTAIRFVAILIGIGAVIALVAFAVSLGGQGTGGSERGSGNPFSALFPFLRGPEDSGSTQTPDAGGDERPSGPVPRLRQVTPNPVSGARFTKDSVIRYIEKETGHVYDVKPDSFDAVRISNMTLPGMERIVWAGDTRFVAQFVVEGERVENVLGVIATTAPEAAMTVAALPGFDRAAASADGKTLLTVTEAGDGARVETIDAERPGSARLIMSSPTRSWIPHIGGRDLLIATAPSAGIPGFLYILESGRPGAKVVGDVPGLMVLPSPDGRYVLYSGNTESMVTTAIYDRNSGVTRTVPTATFAEKCAWFPEGEPRVFCGILKNVPRVDAWLLGLSSSSDDAWLIDPVSGISSRVFDFTTEGGISINLVNASVSPDGKYVIFQNKTDLSLWSLELVPR
ncbi:MAG: hypothetical protein AAB923_02805 [Patescibacteria group bacterium]